MGRNSRRLTMNPNAQEPIDAIDLVRQRTLRVLKSVLGNVSKLDDTSDESMLRVMKDELIDKWSDYIHAYESHEEALSSLSMSAELNGIAQEYLEHHNKYVQAKVHVSRLLTQLQVRLEPVPLEARQAATPQIASSFKMPPIRITPFDGNVCNWIEFKATCESVLRETIPDVQRLQYLKDSLLGEPRTLVSHILPADGSYQRAMNLLKGRYDNTRAIVNENLRQFYAMPSMSGPNASMLRSMLNTVNGFLSALASCNIDTSSWNSIIIFHVSQRFDKTTLEQWEERLEGQRNVPELRKLLEFLEMRIIVTETTETFSDRTTDRASKALQKPQPYKQPYEQKRALDKVKTFYTIKSDYKCVFCAKNHLPSRCDELSRMPPKDRNSIVTRNNLCANCFYPHDVNACPFLPACKKCSQPHNTLLHVNEPQMFLNQVESDQSVEPVDATISSSISDPQEEVLRQISDEYFYHVKETDSARGLLATALVPTKSNHHSVLLKALVDGGSTGNLITVNACRLLHIKYPRLTIPMTGVGGSPVGNVVGRITISIGSVYNKQYSLTIQALVVRSIGDVRGVDKSLRDGWTHLDGLSLADPTYHEPGEIDMLLGTIAHADIMLPQLKKGKRGDPIAQHTELGWLVFGSMRVSNGLKLNCNHVNMISQITEVSDSDLCKQLQAFWEIEEVASRRILTADEQLAEETFVRTVRRTEDGKFMVDLPFKPNAMATIGESREIAERRYRALQRRLERNPQLKQSYDAVFEEYLQLNHMQLVDDKPNTQVFIPHHPVIKETSTTTKVRNVFDASMKTSNGVALNQCLCVGPTIQPELFEQLIQWRKFEFALSGDIEKMYRQMWINPKHANYQCILWQRPGSSSIEEYRLMTVTFGTSSAPFQAVRGLHEVGERIKEVNAELAKIIQNNFYIDDFLKSFKTIEGARQCRETITNTLAQYGFHLRKWKSNDGRTLTGIDESDRECGAESESIFKTLGLVWDAEEDTFIFKPVKVDFPKIWTKRKVLSIIAKLFDPLGWLAPFVIRAKVFMQDIWRLPTSNNWDAALPDQLLHHWIPLVNELTASNPITIPRWLKLSNANETIEIHAFCDASNLAYVACVYVRVSNETGMAACNLIAAKTRVAPIKMTTIPRLELCGALLASKLVVRCKLALRIPEAKVIAWCDSKIVLAWLATHPSKWVTFVANRVSEIQEAIPSRQWLHIPTKQNPADIASRGKPMEELKSCQLWWHGPRFLTTREINPSQDFTLPIEYAPEKRKTLKNFHVITPIPNDVLDKFSDYTQLLRFTCHALRWLTKIKTKGAGHEPISAIEVEAAEKQWIRVVQREHFGHEIGRLRVNRALPMQSKLLRLTPFLDDSGVLRMNGRVGNAEIMEQKRAIILPSDSRFVFLLIQHYHSQQVMHGGVQITLRALREKYWIIHMRRQVQKLIHKCIVCYRTKKLLLTQRMAELPSFRTRQARPFTFVGTDYAGYFEIKASERKNAPTTKAYIALFMCLTTKAFHLEVACDLSSAEFIMVFENFIARRGIPNTVWSDNATNYIGAEREIHELHEQWLKQTSDVTRLMASKRIVFKHIPARASHMAGIWERAVSQVKYHLKRVMKDTKLTARRFDHVLKQIECCLNSRPLWAVTPTEDDIEVITPSHFFNFEPINTLPRPDLEHIPMNRLDQYQYLYRLYTEFWRCWSKEYLTELQPRRKWNKEKPNVRVGQIVVVSEDNLPPSRWPIGKIIAVYPGKDELIRTVAVLCRGKELKRPIHRLGILPILDNDELNHSEMEQLNAGENVASI